MRNGGACEKQIQTIHGELRLKRSVLKVKHEGGIFERDQARAVETGNNMPHIPSTREKAG
ncbi:MAG: hypothetical protein LBP76_11580 [Treponema sp.]|nr:hypothetical protein [Treponema sp.]